MYLQDPVSLLALHRADHLDLVADGHHARGLRARRAQHLRRVARRAYYRSLRRVRALRGALTVPSRAVP